MHTHIPTHIETGTHKQHERNKIFLTDTDKDKETYKAKQ